jgi:hypothetical protein
MEWSQPQLQGHLLTPRAGHAGVTIGENWYIVGGGDNKSGRFKPHLKHSLVDFQYCIYLIYIYIFAYSEFKVFKLFRIFLVVS